MTSVRMGEIAVAHRRGEELVALGLGSCIGLALLDRARGVAGLAHVVLPEAQDAAVQRGKFANLAVPELIAQMRRAGADEARLEAVIAGGARMFELGGDLDVGARNELAVRSALACARIEVVAAATGGKRGRTITVCASTGAVTVREAGGETIALWGDQNGTPSTGAKR